MKTTPLILLLLSLCHPWTAFALSPVDLTCEYRHNPIGIDAPSPRLSWKLEATQRNQAQGAYHLLVASTPELLSAGTGDLWDTGRVGSKQSIQIQYNGLPLEPGQTCYWKVRVWPVAPADAPASPWSAVASWEMGLLDAANWKAVWINDGKSNPAEDADFFTPDPAPLFRTNFQLERPARKARLHISGLGYYDARINGSPVGDPCLDPIWTDYSKRVFYSTYDVTELLNSAQGPNHCLAVTLGNGWYNPLPLRMWGSRNIREWLTTGRPRLIAQLEIELADGSHQTVASNPSWKVAPGPLLRNSIYLGEVYDARREITGWDQPDFDDAQWQHAAPAQEPIGALVAQPLPPIRITRQVTPTSLTEPEPGVFIYDFGQNFAGSVRFTLQAPAGTQLNLRYGELLHPDGRLNPQTSACGQIKGEPQKDATGKELGVWDPVYPASAWQGDSYIAKGTSTETYQPHFTFHAFRYVEVTGLPEPPALDAIVGLRMNSDVAPVGHFQTSNPTLNRIQEICGWTFLSNIFGVQSDCPHRERFGYGGDMVTTCDAFMLNYDMAAFYRKATIDWQDAARDDGMLTDTAPFVGIQYCGVGWAMVHPFLQQKLYQYYGDQQLIEEQYATARKWLDRVTGLYPDHIVQDGLSDHESLVPTPAPPLVTPLYHKSALILAGLADILDRQEDQSRFLALAHSIAEAWNREFVDPQTGRITPETQAVYAFALHLGMLAPDLQAIALNHLIHDITENRGGHLSTGIFGTQYVLQELSRRDQTELAYSIVTNRDFPGWGFMLENGATTLWEHWAFSENTYSHNHPMFGSVSQWFFNWLGGIQPAPEAVGFDQISLQPQFPDDLEWVECHYDSIRGRVQCNWKRSAAGIELEIQIPVQASARLSLPVPEPDSILEQNRPATEATGVRVLPSDHTQSILQLGSGHYQFTIPNR